MLNTFKNGFQLKNLLCKTYRLQQILHFYRNFFKLSVIAYSFDPVIGDYIKKKV